MEHGSPFHQANSSSDSNTSQEGNPIANAEAPSNRNNEGARGEKQPSELRNRVGLEEEHCIPISHLNRIMHCVLPPQAKISNAAKETMQVCVSEFIGFITSEANERCKQEHRRIVTAEDILWAMERLGYENYVGPLSVYLKRYRKNEFVPLAHNRGHVPMRPNVPNYRVPLPPLSQLPPPPLASYYRPMFPSNPNMYQGMFDSVGARGLNKDGSGASGSGSDKGKDKI